MMDRFGRIYGVLVSTILSVGDCDVYETFTWFDDGFWQHDVGKCIPNIDY